MVGEWLIAQKQLTDFALKEGELEKCVPNINNTRERERRGDGLAHLPNEPINCQQTVFS